MSKTTNQFAPEVRERADRMVSNTRRSIRRAGQQLNFAKRALAGIFDSLAREASSADNMIFHLMSAAGEDLKTVVRLGIARHLAENDRPC